MSRRHKTDPVSAVRAWRHPVSQRLDISLILPRPHRPCVMHVQLKISQWESGATVLPPFGSWGKRVNLSYIGSCSSLYLCVLHPQARAKPNTSSRSYLNPLGTHEPSSCSTRSTPGMPLIQYRGTCTSFSLMGNLCHLLVKPLMPCMISLEAQAK